MIACRGRAWRFAGIAVGTLFLAALLSPLVYAVWLSFSPRESLELPVGAWSLRWHFLFWQSSRWTDGLFNSLLVAGLSTGGSVIAGTGLALAVARHQFRGRRLLSAAALLPLFTPALALGMGLLPFMHLMGLWGSPLSLAFAHSLNALPVVFLIVRSALDETSPDLEAAARGLGAGPWRVFWRVTLPLIRPAVLSAALVSFILSLNEFTLALFLCTPECETLPRIIWPNLRYSLSPLVAVASCVTMVVTVLALGLLTTLRRTGLGVFFGAESTRIDRNRGLGGAAASRSNQTT